MHGITLPFVKKIILILFLWVVNSASVHASFVDSIKQIIKENKPVLVGGFHNRNSFLGSIPIKVYGLRGGIEFGERVHLFLGAYTTYNIRDRIQVDSITNRPSIDTIRRYTSLNYLSIGCEYIFFKQKRWTFGFPLMLGFGIGKQEQFINDQFTGKKTLFITPIETGFRSHFSIVEWAGVDATLGLRISPFNSLEFSGFFTSFGVNFYPGIAFSLLKSKGAFRRFEKN
jgi:hypothetical protein